MRKLMAIGLLGLALLVPGIVLAKGNNYINPNEGKCNVQLPPEATPILYRDGGNVISYNLDLDAEVLEATCHFKDSGLELDRALVFRADDYNFDYYCLIKLDGEYYYTLDYRVTLTPSGNVNMTCTADMDIAPSDYRLKQDVTLLEVLDSGIKLYSFKYAWSDVAHVGVLAQDLLLDANHQDAVVIMENQYYAVDYARLGLKMITLDQWMSSSDNIYMRPQAKG